VFWRAGGRPAWMRAPRSGGSHRVMPEIYSPVAKSLITPRMQDGVRGTWSRCGGGFAKQVAGNVDKSEAPTFLRERIEIRLDENLDGLFTGINLDTNRRVAKLNLVASSVFSSNDGAALSARFQGSAVTSLTPSNSGVERLARVTSFLQWKGRNNWQFAVSGRHPGLIIPLRASEGSTLPTCRVHARQAASRHWASG
jgi:hypothetical protein